MKSSLPVGAPPRRGGRAARTAFSWLAAAASLPLLGAAACEGCDRGPAVPFAIESSSPSAAPAAASAPPVGSWAAQATPPARGDRLALGSYEVAAPEGHSFSHVLGGDLDGDGLEDALAWAADAAGGGQLLFLAGRDKGEHRGPVVTERPTPGCRPTIDLSRIGRALFVLALRFGCDGDAGVRGTERLVVVQPPAKPGGAAEARLVLERRAPPAGERLELALSASDRDGDGREDLVVDVDLEGAASPLAPGGRARARLVHLDRPAGLSTDPSEPAASLSARAAELGRLAKDASTAEGVAAEVVALVRLATALCGELGAPSLHAFGRAARCGELEAIRDALAAAAVAAVTRDDLPAAVAWAEALRALADPGKRLSEVDALLDRRAPIGGAQVLGRIPIDPERRREIASPPLAWGPESSLLVLDGDRVVTLGEGGRVEEAQAAAWPREVRWTLRGEVAALRTVARRCGPSAVVATLERDGESIELPIPDREGLVPLPLRREPCTAGALDPGILSLGPDLARIALGASVVELGVEAGRDRARWARAPDAGDPPGPAGAARSTDGRTVAVLAGRDALVIAPSGARRWRAPEIAAASTCSPSPGGERLACRGAGGVVLLGPMR